MFDFAAGLVIGFGLALWRGPAIVAAVKAEIAKLKAKA